MIYAIRRSLVDILGHEYMDAVVQGLEILNGSDKKACNEISREQVEFFPASYSERMDSLLSRVGQHITSGFQSMISGAPTNSFSNAYNINASPIGGFGFFRLGEDGRLYLISKSEHYHTPLGHSFPGYQLIDNARKLGINNATHNNTRGYITRLLEIELVRAANSLKASDTDGIHAVLNSKEPYVLNRVINLETGSLAVEAGIKMMLAKFYKLSGSFPSPVYEGRTPVFLVMADHEGGSSANYHGTTMIAQTMRGLWPDLYNKLEASGGMKVVPVQINDIDDFRTKFMTHNKGPFKVAGFLHEIILMNYGAIQLDVDFLQQAYELCHQNDTPVLVDEIQSCAWYPGMFLFREYGLRPDFVAMGKGFPGGQYPASRIMTTFEMDNLNQFGALITNGQEELASLAYLITMEFIEANTAHIQEVGSYYQRKLQELAESYPNMINSIEGKSHLSGIHFIQEEHVIQFTDLINQGCVDISAQTYKANCPPSAITKLPLIATINMVDLIIERMNQALQNIAAGSDSLQR